MFVHEAKMALPVVDAAIVVVDGVAGVEVVTQRVWNYCEEYKTPRLIVVNRMDRDRANAERVLESLTNAFGRDVIPIELPIGAEKSFTGVVDLVRMKAYTYELAGTAREKKPRFRPVCGRRCRKRTRCWWSSWPRATTS